MKRNTLVWVVIIILIIIGAWYLVTRSSNSNNVAGTSENQQQASSTSDNINQTPQQFSLTSSAFKEGESIPSQYTCDAGATQPNPELSFNNPPAGTKSFALTMYDPDVPKKVLPQGYFNHWVIFNIPATTTEIMASSTVGIQGNNGTNKTGYMGPCPPPQYEPKEHRYIFTLYALDTDLNLKKGATRQQVEAEVKDHTLGQAQLIGRYQRVSR